MSRTTPSTPSINTDSPFHVSRKLSTRLRQLASSAAVATAGITHSLPAGSGCKRVDNFHETWKFEPVQGGIYTVFQVNCVQLSLMEDGQNFLGNFMQFLYIVKSKNKSKLYVYLTSCAVGRHNMPPALQVDL